MKKTFIDITITFYGHHFIEPEVHYHYSDGVTTPVDTYDMDIDTARKLMWELVKEGGKNSYRSNMYNNSISYREVMLWK